ncbi:MAG: hypothetical protein A4E66_00016 [Syntrophus sp. PtaB.Bin001]|nr:MAG: hypothetical protein A4E66_00016 [Syntrophus sp. PtaB.Bin001]
MPDQMFLKPAKDGLLVRDPDTGKALAAEGEYKPRSTYWIRRLKTGDVIAATPSKDSSAAEKG